MEPLFELRQHRPFKHTSGVAYRMTLEIFNPLLPRFLYSILGGLRRARYLLGRDGPEATTLMAPIADTGAPSPYTSTPGHLAAGQASLEGPGLADCRHHGMGCKG
jgi:hypothetical protein